MIESVKKTTQVGSSTCVMCMLDVDRPMLRTCNLGDSGYLIARFSPNQEKFDLVFRSQEQQYSFNFPYQAGTGAELPYNAFDNEHNVEHKDVVVVGSDGLFDNLYNDDILDCLNEQLQPNS